MNRRYEMLYGPRCSVRKAFVAVAAVATMALVLPGTASAHKLVTSAAIAFSDSTPAAGDTVTITGTLNYAGGTNPLTCSGSGCPHTVPSNGTAVVGETLQIEIRQSDTTLGYDPFLGVACDAAVGDWVNVPAGAGESTTTDSSGQVSRAFDTTGLDGLTICFRSHHPSEGGSHGSTQVRSGEISMVIASACEGVTLTNPAVSGGTVNSNGSVKGPWTLSMDLNNCTGETVAFKVQGGATAWAPYNSTISVTDGSYSFKSNKKNTVITWEVTVPDGETETITFGVGSESTVVPCGEVTRPLSGAWSAAYTDPVTSLPTKTEYTAQAVVTSQECQ